MKPCSDIHNIVQAPNKKSARTSVRRPWQRVLDSFKLQTFTSHLWQMTDMSNVRLVKGLLPYLVGGDSNPFVPRKLPKSGLAILASAPRETDLFFSPSPPPLEPLESLIGIFTYISGKPTNKQIDREAKECMGGKPGPIAEAAMHVL